MTIYDEMRGYVNAHDWNGWFDVDTETGPMNQMIQLAEAESAKLRDELDQWHRLTAGIELPEYPITEFQPKDLERENAKLRVERDEWHRVAESKQDIIDHMRDARAENARLRELVRDMYKSMDVSCQFSHAIPVGTMAHIKNRALGLGVEVD